MSEFEAVRADIVWEANTGKTIADIGDLGETYLRTTGAMSDEALRLAAAQDRLTKTIARSGPESTAAKTATLNYRRELGALRTESQAARLAEEARGKASLTTAEQARVNIAAVTGQQRALASLAVEYRKVAAAAVAGSDEQVAAAKLAERALLQLGATNARVAATGRGGGALARDERAGQRVGRGIISGSGLAGGANRALVFGSTAFIGAYGLAGITRQVSDAASAQQAAEGQLETALKNRGQAIAQLRTEITAEVAANAQLGFGETDTTKAMTLAVTATGSLAGATRLLSVAHNVARAKGTDLATATQLLVRAFEGQSRSLKALGINVAAGTKGYTILDQVQAKYSGRAIAYANSEAGARARLRAELERTKVTIGNELLPTEDKLATSIANYLGKASTQAKIQRDVNTAVSTGTEIIHGAKAAYDAIAPPIQELIHLLGGAKTATELFLALWAGNKLRNGLLELGLLKTATLEVGAAAGTAAVETEAAMGGIAASEAVAGGRLATLRKSLRGLSGLTLLPIIIPVEVVGLEAAAAKIKALQQGYLDAQSAPTTDAQKAALVPGLAAEYKRLRAQGVSAGAAIVKLENQLGSDIHTVVVHDKSDPSGAHDTTKVVGTATLQSADIVASAINYAAGGPEKKRIDSLRRKSGQSTPGAAGTPPPARPSNLDRQAKVTLALAAAQAAISRGEKGAQQTYIKALKDQIDYEQAAEKTQLRLIKTDPANAKQHAQELAQAYSGEQSARDTIASIQQAEAQKSAAARAKALAQLKAADAKRRKDYQAALDLRESILKRNVAGATTIPATRKAEDALTAFYKTEAADAHLTRLQREHYATLAQKEHAAETAKLKKITEKDLENRVAQAKLAVDKAKGNETATAKAIAAEKQSYEALIKFYDADAHNKNLTVAARQDAKRKEIAEQTALANLDKKKTTVGDAGANEREAIATLQTIIQNQSNFSLEPVHATLKQIHTRLFQAENHLSNIRSNTDSRGLPQSTADAAVAHGVSETAFV